MPRNDAMAVLCQAILIPFFALLAAADPAGGTELYHPQRFTIEVPEVVLTDVPVSFVRITAWNPDGTIDRSFDRAVLVTGIRLSTPRDVGDSGIRSAAVRDDAELPPFRNGVLELKTDLAKRRKVFIESSQIVVDPRGHQPAVLTVPRTHRWFSVVPPLLAIVLAIWLKNVIVALFAGVYSGAVILTHGDFFRGLLNTLDTHILGEFAPVSDGQVDWNHLMIIFFTMFLGAMVGVMWQSGGTAALVGSMDRFTKTRQRGQLMTWALGLLVFFDDYANTLLVGSSMRPVTDRLKISREKLAFLVDSTAAPIAGLALVSTWVGIEIEYIRNTYADLGMEADGFEIFLATIPYRFYALHMLAFVCLVAFIGHDFGPMLRAEARALSGRQPLLDGLSDGGAGDDPDREVTGRRRVARNAWLPLAALLIMILVGLWWSGSEALAAANQQARAAGAALTENTFWNVLGSANSSRVLFLSSFLASILAVASAAVSRSLTVGEAMDAWARGAKGMFYPLLILVLAWSIATICNPQNLNTAGFLVELSDGAVSVVWMPCLAFLLAGVVAFATGSSWSTMGLLMPLMISVTYYLLLDENDVVPMHHLLLGTIGGVLAGSIFGDHCSPISDTTVLSSAASGCDHLSHVATQLPYAASVAGISLLLGYLPAGFGYSPVVLLPLGLLVMFLLVQFVGRSAEEAAGQLAEAEANQALDTVPDLADLEEAAAAPPRRDDESGRAEQ